jgi:hypothetical protein
MAVSLTNDIPPINFMNERDLLELVPQKSKRDLTMLKNRKKKEGEDGEN